MVAHACVKGMVALASPKVDGGCELTYRRQCGMCVVMTAVG